MIYSISGRLTHKGPDTAVVEAAGVGYQIACTGRHLDDLGAVGSEVRILTHLVHREDAMILYGFASADDRALFLLLVAITGVGASKALALLGLGGAELSTAIRTGDARWIAQAPGVGAKIAQRIVLELKSKLSGQRPTLPEDLPAPVPAALAEAEIALLTLGYTDSEVRLALAQISESTTVEEAIRQGILALTQAAV